MKINTILFNYDKFGEIHYNNLEAYSEKFDIKYIIYFNDINSEINKDIPYIFYDENQKLIDILKSQNINIEAAIITCPKNLQFKIIQLCLEYNKHIFVNKPLCFKYNNIIECYELAKKNNKILFVGYYKRFEPSILNIKSEIESIQNVNYCLCINRKMNKTDVSENIFYDYIIHDIDFLNWILEDKPIQLSVMNDDYTCKNYNFNNININLKYSLGTICSINLSSSSSYCDQRYEFYGTNGEIISNEYNMNEKVPFYEKFNKSFKNEILYFYDYIKNNKKCIVSKNDSLSNLIITEACQESVDKNSKITIKYVSDKSFRNYSNTTKSVMKNYKLGRIYQTLEFSLNMRKKYGTFNIQMNFWEIFDRLNSFVDISDPDISFPNIIHAFQSAEKARIHNKPEWFILTCLIHDLGKIIHIKGNNKDGTGKKIQWAIVGDTFPVGCELSDKLIYPEFNSLNLEKNKKKYGIYKKNCGLDNLIMSYGHDEYLYKLLTSPKNPNLLPLESLYIIRFHSFYAYHTEKDYLYFQNEKDILFFRHLEEFNKYDLYTKSDEIINIDKLKPYYSSLIKKFFCNEFLYL